MCGPSWASWAGLGRVADGGRQGELADTAPVRVDVVRLDVGQKAGVGDGPAPGRPGVVERLLRHDEHSRPDPQAGEPHEVPVALALEGAADNDVGRLALGAIHLLLAHRAGPALVDIGGAG